jgi:hypothetical protein
MAGVTIRPATDVPAIARIWREGWPDGHEGHVPAEWHCCVAPTPGTLKPLAFGSDHQGEFVERDGQPPARWFLYRQS